MAGRTQPRTHIGAAQLSVLVFAFVLVDEQVLHGDDVTFHADDLGDVRDAAAAVAHAADLHDKIHRVGDLLLDGVGAEVESGHVRSEEHTSELQSLMRISYAVFCLKNKNNI